MYTARCARRSRISYLSPRFSNYERAASGANHATAPTGGGVACVSGTKSGDIAVSLRFRWSFLGVNIAIASLATVRLRA